MRRLRLASVRSRPLLYACVLLFTFAWMSWRQHGVRSASARVHLFLPMNERALLKDPDRKGELFCKTLLSALATGYDPIIYNWDLQPIGKKSHRAKVTGFLNLLEQRTSELDLGEQDIVVLADALDIWFQLPPADLARRFDESGGKPVAGAEGYCFPQAADSDVCRDAPPSPLPPRLFSDASTAHGGIEPELSRAPRYANSGFVVGRVRDMRPLFRKLVASLEDPGYKWPYDQGAFNIALVQGDLSIDHRFRLVWCSIFDPDSAVFINHGRHPDGLSDSALPFDLYPSLGRHKTTGECPVALHFNGRHLKSLLKDRWNATWYGGTRPALRDFARRTVHGRRIRIVLENQVELRDPAVLCAAHWSW